MEHPPTRASVQEQRRKVLAARIHECRGLGMSVALTCDTLGINERMYYKCFHESGGIPNKTNKPLRCVAKEIRGAYESGPLNMPSVAQIAKGRAQINRVDRSPTGKFAKKGAGTTADAKDTKVTPNLTAHDDTNAADAAIESIYTSANTTIASAQNNAGSKLGAMQTQNNPPIIVMTPQEFKATLPKVDHEARLMKLAEMDD